MATVSKKATVNMLDKVGQKFLEQLEVFFNVSGYSFEKFATFYNDIPCDLIKQEDVIRKNGEKMLSLLPSFSCATTYNAEYLLPFSRKYKGNMVSGLYPYYFTFSESIIRENNPTSDTYHLSAEDAFQEMHIVYPGTAHKKMEENLSIMFANSTEDVKDYIQVMSVLFIGLLNLGGNTYDYSTSCYIKRKPTLASFEKFFSTSLRDVVNKSKTTNIAFPSKREVFPNSKFINEYTISTGCLPITLVEDTEVGGLPKVVKVQKDLIYYNDSYYMAGVFKNKPDGNYTKEDYSILISSSLFAEEKFNNFSRIVTKYYLPLLMRLNPELKVEILSHDEIQKRLSTNNFITKTNSDVRRALLELA